MMAPGQDGTSASPSSKYPLHLTRRDERGDRHLGRRFGPDSQPILRVDGPFPAPAAHYKHYGTLMLVGAGIGMTPCASIITAMLRYRWRKNFKPEIVHFYWIINHADLAAFEWFVRLLADLEAELLHERETGQVAPRNYVEMHAFVTRAPDHLPPRVELPKLHDTTAAQRGEPTVVGGGYSSRRRKVFNAEDLKLGLATPTVAARDMVATMARRDAPNRYQDVWVWKGRPNWAAIFPEVRAQRQHRDIGVCFCGPPAVATELARACKSHSSKMDDGIFTLHKENF